GRRGATRLPYTTLFRSLRRPDVSYEQRMSFQTEEGQYLAGPGLSDPASAEQVEIQIKYAGYVQRQKEDVAKLLTQEAQPIPDDLDRKSTRLNSSHVKIS